jgi:uncharacterized protein GlcG (DUF336 family)
LLSMRHASAVARVKTGEETIGAVGVSGAPGGDKDEACAKTGLDKAPIS